MITCVHIEERRSRENYKEKEGERWNERRCIVQVEKREMLKRRRSRPLWGISSLSAIYLSCGLMFLMGNIYILHSGFSQAYSSLEQGDSAFLLLQPQEPGGGTGGVRTVVENKDKFQEGILRDLPVVALAAFGFQKATNLAHLEGKQFLHGEGINKPQHRQILLQSPVLQGGGSDTRLRKLMENRREGWQVEGEENERSLIVPGVSNTGRKQRTNGDKASPVRAMTSGLHSTPPHHHLFSPNHHVPLQDLSPPPHPDNHVLYYQQHSDHHVSNNNPITDNYDKVVPDHFNVGHYDKKDPRLNGINRGLSHVSHTDVVDIGVNDLRRWLGHGSQCGMVRNLTGKEYISSGWTKTVHRALLPGGRTAGEGPPGLEVAVKNVDLTGHDVNSCIKEAQASLEFCYNRASQKLMKEIVLLNTFNNPHIIKMLGYCVPKKPYDGAADGLVTMVTELGETIDIIKLLQMSWEDRLRVSYGLTKLLQYLAESPFGTISLNDFRRQQFVLVRDDVTLTDVDDVGVGEPRCETEADCMHYFSTANFTLRTPCRSGRCEGFNEKKNIFNAARHFTTFLLPHGAPPSLKPAINRIVHAYSNATSRASTLLHWLDEVVESYRTGIYVNRTSQENINKYLVQSDADLPGLHDYRCRFSIASVGCTLSVLDQREAEQLCDLDPECRGFVISKKRTWAGRMLVHLKNNVTSAMKTPGLTLCVKPNKGL